MIKELITFGVFLALGGVAAILFCAGSALTNIIFKSAKTGGGKEGADENSSIASGGLSAVRVGAVNKKKKRRDKKIKKIKRVRRHKQKHGAAQLRRVQVAVECVLLSLLLIAVFVAAFMLVLKTNMGYVRLYMLVAIFAGFIICQKTAGKFVASLANKAYNFSNGRKSKKSGGFR